MSQVDLASTATLIQRIQHGEDAAREQLVERCLPLLRRWAHGRLPYYGRELSETDDLVQTALMRALGRIDSFQPERQGAFLAYLRQILLNAIRHEIRSVSRRPKREPLVATGRQEPAVEEQRDIVADLDAYEKGLATLSESTRQAVILRFEFGMTFPEIADELEMSSPDAVRMAVSRALLEIADVLT